MSTSDTVPTVEAVPVPPDRAAVTTRVVVWVALVLTLLAWLAMAMLWQRLGKTQEELARRSSNAQAEVAAAKALASQAESVTQDLQARLSVAEVKLSEVSLQRSQLEELMLSVSRSRDDSLVQDLESSLRLAVQQSQLTGSVQPMISTLQAADHRIARAAQPRLNPVQRAMVRDIDRIRSTPWVDVATLVGRIDDLMHGVDTWPVLNSPRQTGAQAVPPRVPDQPVTWPAGGDGRQWLHWGKSLAQRWWSSLASGTSDLLRISRIDHPEAALLTPEQAYFLRENLKLTLLNVRMGLLSRQWGTAQQDAQGVERLLSRYFNADDPAIRQARASLTQLQRDLQQGNLPIPEDTLAALTVAAGGR
ncbi:MAG TPA: uroporphyrinogen-III C-methyltransferase [Macromonas sp.]|nr:uroporphyrinogen-III C-methyltransferase [Macromonas sp.]